MEEPKINTMKYSKQEVAAINSSWFEVKYKVAPIIVTDNHKLIVTGGDRQLNPILRLGCDI